MKQLKTVLLLVLLVSMLFSLTACTIKEDSEELRTLADQMIQGLMDDDFETCYNLVKDSTTREEFTDVYPRLQQPFTDADSYTLTQTGWNKHTGGGVTEVAVQYILTVGESRYSLKVSNSTAQEGLKTFYLSPVASAEESEMRLLGTPEQTVLLVIALAETAFMVWMLIDCAKRKIKQKWLWIVLILAGVAVTTTRTGDNLQLNLSIGLFFNFTAKYVSAVGNSVTRILLPAGALWYLFIRKRLTMQTTAPETQPAESLPTTEEVASPVAPDENHNDGDTASGEA